MREEGKQGAGVGGRSAGLTATRGVGVGGCVVLCGCETWGSFVCSFVSGGLGLHNLEASCLCVCVCVRACLVVVVMDASFGVREKNKKVRGVEDVEVDYTGGTNNRSKGRTGR